METKTENTSKQTIQLWDPPIMSYEQWKQTIQLWDPPILSYEQ